MINTQYKENDTIFTLESLDLDFSKKKQRRSTIQGCASTERKNKVPLHIPVQPLRTDRSVLVEKKKNYSQAIRQRNLNLISKKKHDSSCLTKPSENTSQAKGLSLLKQNLNNEQLKKQKTSNNNMSIRKQKQNLKLAAHKKSFVSTSILDVQLISFSPSFQTKILNQVISVQKQEICQNLKSSDLPIKKSNQKLKLCSNEFSQKIIVLDSDTTILVKQNATFKRDLANFRKQNSILRKQLKDAQKHIGELELKVKNILQVNAMNPVKLNIQQSQSQIINNDNCSEIMEKLRQENIELQNLNSGLQLRVYMAEKKIVQEVTSCKKKMAKQIHDWRQKCTKLRAENYRFKSYKDVTISMEISKDQQIQQF